MPPLICWTSRRTNGTPYKVCIPKSKSKSKKTASTKATVNSLVGRGFYKKVAPTVLARMKQTGRPANNFSKTTGKVKRDAKKKR